MFCERCGKFIEDYHYCWHGGLEGKYISISELRGKQKLFEILENISESIKELIK